MKLVSWTAACAVSADFHAGELTRSSSVFVAEDLCLPGDPLVEGDDDPALAALDNLAGSRVRILISKPFHTHSAEPLWRRYCGSLARAHAVQLAAWKVFRRSNRGHRRVISADRVT